MPGKYMYMYLYGFNDLGKANLAEVKKMVGRDPRELLFQFRNRLFVLGSFPVQPRKRSVREWERERHTILWTKLRYVTYIV